MRVLQRRSLCFCSPQRCSNKPIHPIVDHPPAPKPPSTMPHRLIDIGVNLTDSMYQGVYGGKQYHPPDLDAVLQRAWAAGVQRIIITAGNLEDAHRALQLAQTDGTPLGLSTTPLRTTHQCPSPPKKDRLFCTVGCHPTRCREFESYEGGPQGYLAALHDVAQRGVALGKCVAIGELGLDYDR